MARRISKANLKPRLNMVIKSFVAGLVVKAAPGLLKKVGADKIIDGNFAEAAAGGVSGFALGFVLNDPDIRDISLGLAAAQIAEPTVSSFLQDAADMVLPNYRPLYLQNSSNYGTVPTINDYTNFVSTPDDYQSYYGRR